MLQFAIVTQQLQLRTGIRPLTTNYRWPRLN